MVAQNDDPKKGQVELESRPPTLEDFVDLCRKLNQENVRYIVIGGMAIIQHGFVRATEDIDLLVDANPKNFKALKKALLSLPDQAVSEVEEGDLEKYPVIRVADEFVVDLMKSANGLDYEDAKKGILRVKIEGVEIPFASVELLLKLKQPLREKDRLDLQFLERLKKS